MPYFVKNELYTVPDSPVDADFNEVFCTGTCIKCTIAKLWCQTLVVVTTQCCEINAFECYCNYLQDISVYYT